VECEWHSHTQQNETLSASAIKSSECVGGSSVSSLVSTAQEQRNVMTCAEFDSLRTYLDFFLRARAFRISTIRCDIPDVEWIHRGGCCHSSTQQCEPAEESDDELLARVRTRTHCHDQLLYLPCLLACLATRFRFSATPKECPSREQESGMTN